MFWRRLISLTVLSVLPLALIGCSEKPHSDPRSEAPLVRAVMVEDATPDARTFTGVIAARVESDLGFRVSGKVLERLVNTGQRVKRGQALLRIDPVDLKLTALALQEAVVAARARSLQTAADEARYRGLRGTGAVSDSSYDQSKAAALSCARAASANALL